MTWNLGIAGGWKRLAGLSFLSLIGVDLACGDSLLPPMNGQPGDFAVRRSGAGTFLKIAVTNDGLFKIGQSDLTGVGVDPQSLTGSQVRLFTRTQEVAIAVSQPGLWTNGDYMVFYGLGRKGEYSDANIYWLGLDGAGGLRMGARDAAPPPGGLDVTTSPRRVGYDRKTFLQDKYRAQDGGHDHWFCATLSETERISCALATPQAVTSENATLTVVLYGHSSAGKINPDHLTRIWFNGKRIVSILFDGQTAVTQSCAVAGALLRKGNSVAFRQFLRNGVPVDRVYLDRFDIDYVGRLVMEEGRLIFGGRSGNQAYKVGGLAPTGSVWLADVTDPAAPEWLLNAESLVEGGDRVVRFRDDAGSGVRRYAVVGESGLLAPAGLERVDWVDLGDPGRQADYVIVAPTGFVPVLQALAARREGEGLRTVVVSLSDVYNEFGYGVEDASALKQFIGYAVHHWQAPAPRYVLLAGSGSYDPKGYLLEQRGMKAYRMRERIPVKMGPWEHGWASQDGWYGTVSGSDLIPDVAIGRLPAESSGMLSNMIAKIMINEAVPARNWRRKQALLVADWADASLNGKAACEYIRKADLAPNGFWTTTAYTDDIGYPLARSIILNTIERGVFMVYYFGHGSVNRWGHNIINYRDVMAFQNKYPPLFVLLACRNGAFQNPLDGPCMMETLLQSKTNGASACIGTTAISYGASCVAFSDGFSQTMINDKSKRLGDAFLAGLESLADYNPYTEELIFLNLFADPAMVVNP